MNRKTFICTVSTTRLLGSETTWSATKRWEFLRPN